MEGNRMSSARFWGIIASAICAMIVSTGAFAEDICGQEYTDEQIVGEYTVTLGVGFLAGGVAFQPIDEAESFPGTMSLIDGVLGMDSGGLFMEFELAREGEPEWRFDTVPGLDLSSEDLRLLAGCEAVSELPRLIGEAEVVAPDGTPIDYLARLIGHTLNFEGEPVLFVGSLSWRAGGLDIYRTMKLERIEE